MMPSAYQQEQQQALKMVRAHLSETQGRMPVRIGAGLADYRDYRLRLDDFIGAHFRAVCQPNCYNSRLSACCSREGIITFFADAVINALASSAHELEALERCLLQPNPGFKCIYLGPLGCLWRIRPLGCALFVCDRAEQQVLDPEPSLRRCWQSLRDEARLFRWPDRPVLFDDLEQWWMAAGYHSSLMYLNTSSGMLRIKRRAGLVPAVRTGS